MLETQFALPNHLVSYAVMAEEGIIIIIDFLLEFSYMLFFFPLAGGTQMKILSDADVRLE